MFGDDFYPTLQPLIDAMLAKVDFTSVESILEPSAGRGDIVEHVMARKSRGTLRGHASIKIDTVESDDELAMILDGKGYKPVARDFLTFKSFKRYDLIIMNPPFSGGDKHLTKAIEMQRDGGQIVCLLNAETLKNPYTNSRRELVGILESLGASVEYLVGAFTGATRTTNVETALVYVNIPVMASSDILENLKRAQALQDEESHTASDILEGEYIAGAVRRYEIEARAGLALIREYKTLAPLLSRGFTDDKHPILTLQVDGERGDLQNAFVERLRMKYWQELFQSEQFAGMFTTKTRETYRESIRDLSVFEFTTTNIKQMQADLSAKMLTTLDGAIVNLFDEFSAQYYDEHSKNIHYYNGWKTNKAHRINKKVVTRLNAYDTFDGRYSPECWDVQQKIADIVKVFSYLDGKLLSDTKTLVALMQEAGASGTTKAVDFEYIKVDFYKKGTAHITFTRPDLLKKFNLIGSQRKGWLPPAYGVKSYTAMNDDERAVVDSFEGEESYAETVANREFYVSRASLSLGAGVAA